MECDDCLCVNNRSSWLGDYRSSENSPSRRENAKGIFNNPPRPTQSVVEDSFVFCKKVNNSPGLFVGRIINFTIIYVGKNKEKQC